MNCHITDSWCWTWIFLLFSDISLSKLGACAWAWSQRGINSHFLIENSSVFGISSSKSLTVLVLQHLCSWRSWDTRCLGDILKGSGKFISVQLSMHTPDCSAHFWLPGRNKQKSTGDQLSAEALLSILSMIYYLSLRWSLMAQQLVLPMTRGPICRGPTRSSFSSLIQRSSSSGVNWGVLKMKQHVLQCASAKRCYKQ